MIHCAKWDLIWNSGDFAPISHLQLPSLTAADPRSAWCVLQACGKSVYIVSAWKTRGYSSGFGVLLRRCSTVVWVIFQGLLGTFWVFIFVLDISLESALRYLFDPGQSTPLSLKNEALKIFIGMWWNLVLHRIKTNDNDQNVYPFRVDLLNFFFCLVRVHCVAQVLLLQPPQHAGTTRICHNTQLNSRDLNIHQLPFPMESSIAQRIPCRRDPEKLHLLSVRSCVCGEKERQW